jgi:cold shock CspA family protein/ribosome-associated translation inhibitor RaiA
VNIPPEISYRNVEKNDQIESLLQKEIDSLERVCDHISSCRIAVEKLQEHQQSGSPFRVRVDVRVPPGHELVSRREPGDGEMHEKLQTVIRDVFKGMKRQLKDLVDKQQGHVKTHPAQQAAALVDRIFKEEGYGFIKNLSGQDVYFHQNSVLHNDFDRMEEGTGVTYFEEMGDEGLQASSIKIVDKPGKKKKQENPEILE